MKKLIPMAGAALVLAGCATTMPADPDAPATRPTGNECNADSVQGMVGQKATAELGAQVMAETGAASMRWIPPRTAVTMDFRADRLNISYDDDMVIDRISCG